MVKVRQTPLKPERHAKLLEQEKAIYDAASSKLGRELGQAHLAKYGAEPDPSLNQPNAHKAPPIPPKGKPAMAAEKPPVNPHTVTPPETKPKQYGKLKNPAVIRADSEGKEHVIRGTNGEKHHAPGGKFTPEEKAYFNYEHPHERTERLAKSKAATKARKAAQEANPDFTTTQSKERTDVHWHKGQEAAPEPAKPSVAKEHAVAMTSQSVKNAIHAANPTNDADARTKAAGPKVAAPKTERKKVGMASGRMGPGFSRPVSKEPPTKPMSKLSATRAEPAVKATTAQPAAGKSFDTHANEAMSVANSGRAGKSFSQHANEALSVANSGRAPQPTPSNRGARANVSQPQFSRAQQAPKPAPQPESTFVSTKAPAKTSAPSQPQSRFVESRSVDAVSGLEPSRAKRTAVKAARKLDRAAEYHAKDARGRQNLKQHNDEIRQASKRQGPIDLLVNGPKERPEVTRSAVRHATINAAINVGQKIQDRKLAKAQSGYEKARSKAESTHDAIRAGTKRGSTSDVGAVAGSVGRTVAKGAVAGAKVLAEGTRDIARAEVTGVKRIAARAKTEIAAKQGRAPESPRPQPNRNVNNRQFGSRNAPTRPGNSGGE